MSPSISVVIPNYNGKKLLEANLPSVYKALSTSGITDFEIIVCDDASKDDSVDFIKENYLTIILIESIINRGFSGNCNLGIFKAKKELVFLLNNDVVLTEGYFIPLLPYFEKTDTFGVMGKIIGLTSDKIQDGAKYPEYNFGNIVVTKNYYSPTTSVLYSLFLSGANALVDRKKLLELGGFNEIYSPYYFEDSDLGLRAWKVGYSCYYDERAVCRHPLSATINKEPSKKVKIISKRNKMIFHYIHLDAFPQIYFMAILFLKVLIRVLIIDRNYIESYIRFIFSLKECRKAKSEISELQKKNGVKISLSDVLLKLKGNIPMDAQLF